MKYFITDRRSGLGDALLNLVATWWLAKEYGGSVIIDWSKLPYTVTNWDRDGGNFSRHKVNIFNSLFEMPPPLEGVKFETPEQFSELFFDDWNNALKDINELPLVKMNGQHLEETLKQGDFIRVRSRLGAPFSHPKFPRAVDFNFVDFFNHLPIQKKLKKEIDKFFDSNFKKNSTVGLHLRHGTGESVQGRTRRECSPELKVKEVLEFSKDKLGDLEKFKYFICTDNQECEDLLLKKFPNSFSFPKKLPSLSDDNSSYHQSHQGASHYNPHLNPINSIKEAFFDLYLLSRCDVFMGSNYSVFSYLAQKSIVEVYEFPSIIYSNP